MGYSGFDSGAGQFSVSDNGAPEYVAGGPMRDRDFMLVSVGAGHGLERRPHVRPRGQGVRRSLLPTSPIRGLRRDADGQRFLSDCPGTTALSLDLLKPSRRVLVQET